ncbi:MAG TPA: ankyrin repeat domain-containing protein [Patescibacteria group bacterium]|nr:ankyrin repeat domain-containing protein [Patescibacteria group bacterium]
MKHVFTFAFFIILSLSPAAARAAESALGPFAPKTDEDRQRVGDMLGLAEDVIAYAKKAGHYPLADTEPQAEMTVVGITDYKSEAQEGSPSPKEKLEAELKKVLGNGVELHLDPIEGKQGQELRIYQYATDGQDFWVSADLLDPVFYTRKIRDEHFKLEITSRPLKRDSQFSVAQLKRFLKFGADDSAKQAGLAQAVEDRDFEAIRKAVKDGANLDPICEFDDICKPLARVAHAGDQELVALLLELGADIDGFSAFDEVPLIYAIGNDKRDVAKYLVEKGADVNRSSAFAATPFLGAVSTGDLELATLMLPKGADVNRRYLALNSNAKPGDMGNRPLEAAINAGSSEMVMLLLKNGADPALTGKDGKSMTEIGLASGDKKIIALFQPPKKK